MWKKLRLYFSWWRKCFVGLAAGSVCSPWNPWRLGLCGGEGEGCWAVESLQQPFTKVYQEPSCFSACISSKKQKPIFLETSSSEEEWEILQLCSFQLKASLTPWNILCQRNRRGGEKVIGILLGPSLRSPSLDPRCFPSNLCLISLAKRVCIVVFWTFNFFLIVSPSLGSWQREIFDEEPILVTLLKREEKPSARREHHYKSPF